LGPKGQDIIMMLTQGAGQLKDQMAGVAIASETAVDAMAKVGDAIDSSQQALTSWLATAVDAFQTATLWVAAFWEATGSDFNARELFNAAKKAQTEEAGSSGKNKDFEAQDKEAAKAKADAAKSAAEAAKKIDEEMLKLARSRMDAEAKIADLKREQAIHAAAAQDKTKSEADRGNAAVKVLQLQQEIEAGQAELAKAKQKAQEEAAKEAEKKANDAAKAESNLADEERAQKLEKMGPEERITELKKQQKALNDQANQETDPQTKAEKKLEALKLNDDIDAAMKELKPDGNASKPAVITSSLGSVGGGGGAYIGTDPALTEARKQTNLLQQIARGLAGAGQTHFSAPKSPF
jgi:chemotaxis protein histidine kinase CheA